MIVIAVTKWEGTPEKIQETVDNVKAAADLHASLGAKNPRFWRSVSGGGVQKAYYSIEFDSHEDYGKWQDAMMESEFWPEFQKFINEGYPDIEYISTDIYYSMI
jgi:hypothetical protein